MMALLHRGLLYAGMILMQPTPTPPAITGDEVTDVIDAINSTANTFQDFTIGLAALFILGLFLIMIIVYLYSNRNASKGAIDMMTTFANAMGGTLKERDERIDRMEDQGADRDGKYIESFQAFSDAMNRTADVLTILQRNEVGRDRLLSDAVSAITTLVTVGSKPLQEVVKDVGAVKDTNEEISTVVGKVYDILLLNFPAEESLEVRFETLKRAMIDAIEQACEKAKHDTSEVATITLPQAIDITLHSDPAPTDAAPGGESGTLPTASGF